MKHTPQNYFKQIKLDDSVKFDLLDLHQANPARYPFLLESVAQGKLGQFDILFSFPQASQTCQDSQTSAEAKKFIANFTKEFDNLKVKPSNPGKPSKPSFLPFNGGWFSYFSYDYAKIVEPTLDLPSSDLPLAKLVRIPCAVIYSHSEASYYLIAETAYNACLELMHQDIQSLMQESTLHTKKNTIQSRQEEPNSKYLNGVNIIKEYILAGDVFQVNLSKEWQVEMASSDAVAIYKSLRKHNPAPFAGLVDFGEWKIISSSPERLVKYDNKWVEVRPIAGTRKRSLDLEADNALIKELISHPKERAEHIMLIDLERNDLGRICVTGTVEVNELMVIETYEHVHHIVSNIRGKLLKGLNPLEIIHAVFPGGTITGCPKVRCMEIIAELEQMPRKAYTGSIGYINRDGSLDLNILIRTMMLQNKTLSFRAGAGIVADSVAEQELEESYHKAKGLINAL